MSFRQLDIETELRYVEIMVDDLKPYLLGDALFWPLHHMGLMGTLGGLLLRVQAFTVLSSHLSARQSERCEHYQQAAHEQIDRWWVQAESKAAQEVTARQRSWKHFIADCNSDPELCRREYPYRVEERIMITLLQPVAERGLDEAMQTSILTLDRRVESITASAEFVWDEQIQLAFPSDSYPWLYRLPVEF